MATDNNNIDLLQRFIDNEKKAKKFTTIVVALFCLLAFGVVMLAIKLSNAKTTIASQQTQIEKLNDSLTKAIQIADSINDVLVNRNNSLQNNSYNYDSLQNITNSLLISLADLKEKTSVDTGIMVATIDKQREEVIKKLITPANIRKIRADEKKYTVYVQYLEGYKNDALKLQKWWQDEYICPQPELITNRSVAPTVNYFYAEDAGEAKKVADFVKQKTKLNVKLNNFSRLNAPKKQLEVWLGEYKARTTKEILDKYDVKQVLQTKQ